ncbi:hypothetical protein BKA93DRAFT_824078 [Sparassis latifolia]
MRVPPPPPAVLIHYLQPPATPSRCLAAAAIPTAPSPCSHRNATQPRIELANTHSLRSPPGTLALPRQLARLYRSSRTQVRPGGAHEGLVGPDTHFAPSRQTTCASTTYFPRASGHSVHRQRTPLETAPSCPSPSRLVAYFILQHALVVRRISLTDSRIADTNNLHVRFLFLFLLSYKSHVAIRSNRVLVASHLRRRRRSYPESTVIMSLASARLSASRGGRKMRLAGHGGPGTPTQIDAQRHGPKQFQVSRRRLPHAHKHPTRLCAPSPRDASIRSTRLVHVRAAPFHAVLSRRALERQRSKLRAGNETLPAGAHCPNANHARLGVCAERRAHVPVRFASQRSTPEMPPITVIVGPCETSLVSSRHYAPYARTYENAREGGPREAELRCVASLLAQQGWTKPPPEHV